MSTPPQRYRAVRENGEPVLLSDLAGVSPEQVAAAVTAAVEPVTDELALKANQADVDEALSSVASETDVEKRLIGGVRDLEGDAVPTKGLFAVVDANGEIDDLVIEDVT